MLEKRKTIMKKVKGGFDERGYYDENLESTIEVEVDDDGNEIIDEAMLAREQAEKEKASRSLIPNLFHKKTDTSQKTEEEQEKNPLSEDEKRHMAKENFEEQQEEKEIKDLQDTLEEVEEVEEKVKNGEMIIDGEYHPEEMKEETLEVGNVSEEANADEIEGWKETDKQTENNRASQEGATVPQGGIVLDSEILDSVEGSTTEEKKQTIKKVFNRFFHKVSEEETEASHPTLVSVAPVVSQNSGEVSQKEQQETDGEQKDAVIATAESETTTIDEAPVWEGVSKPETSKTEESMEEKGEWEWGEKKDEETTDTQKEMPPVEEVTEWDDKEVEKKGADEEEPKKEQVAENAETNTQKWKKMVLTKKQKNLFIGWAVALILVVILLAVSVWGQSSPTITGVVDETPDVSDADTSLVEDVTADVQEGDSSSDVSTDSWSEDTIVTEKKQHLDLLQKALRKGEK